MVRTNIRILLVGDDSARRSRSDNTSGVVKRKPRMENREQLDVEIRRADVICIVYGIDAPDSFERIQLFWLPYIRKLGRNVPIVLVGNKIDLRGNNITNTDLETKVMPIMNEFKEVETCIECSVKQGLNCSEVFYFAQKAVSHPTAPLYDSREHTMKQACVDALIRIFKLCDKDKDSILNDEEINEFQTKCFGSPLQRQELESIKEVVKENEADGVNEKGLTQRGFLYLHNLFIQKGRLETTWTVLRRFGYGDDLSLREDFLWPSFECPVDCSVELSSDGYQFFTELFQSHDLDKDGALKESELEELFSTAPCNPWLQIGFPQTTITNNKGSVTLQGFIAQWSMTTLLDYKTTLAYLAYLGYNDQNQTSALKITRQRRLDRKRGKIQRNVFLCYCFGGTGSGKSSLLKGFVEKTFDEKYTPTSKPYSVVNSVEIGGAEKYLVMQEFGPRYDTEVLQNKKKMESCDVICFLYDSGDVNSFAYVANLKKKYLDDFPNLPIVFVASKSDCDLVQQRYDSQPDEFCREIGISVPISVSIKEKINLDIFNLLVGVAIEP
ncbi:ERMES complex Ca(2+)-binding regulatory GTPase gem1 [Clydaea vesicula]|uniref:Mitochondrial Rho GTPase 1 n=1 Tax=Clydaea vesicula TaxID=447962 RepID=A0AAD5XXF1_9FUNG|nr:ERMES complex Ca(2+)-binding regulatory GTPase gem1 [Clydaea vesicula]